MSKRDENREVVAMGISATDGTPMPLLVDPTTGRLLIAVTTTTESGDDVFNVKAIDENREGTACGVDDDENVIPWHIDSRNDLLYLDILAE